MPDMKLSRRGLVQLGLGAATAGFGHRQRGQFWLNAAPIPTTSITNAFLFLNQMMDAYAQGSTVRLCQSYADQDCRRHLPQHSVHLR